MTNLINENVTILIVTFNRSQLLRRLVDSLTVCESVNSFKIICSDDCSNSYHRKKIDRMGFDQVLTGLSNRGLGNNVNKGLLEVNSPYVLLLQDDWILVNKNCIADAIKILDTDPSVGMIRFYGDPEGFPLVKKEINGLAYWVADHLSLEYKESLSNTPRHRVYSDTPHLRRSTIHTTIVGYYSENGGMEECEMDYENRVDNQNHFFVAFLSGVRNDCFIHTGKDESFRTGKFRYKLDRLFLFFVEKTNLKNLSIYSDLRILYRKFFNFLIRIKILK